MKKFSHRGLEALCVLVLVPAVAQAGATVYVVHGIPGEDLNLVPSLPVDVSVNGQCALPEFTFGEIVGPLALDAGEYDIAISLADPANPCGNAPVIEADDLILEEGQTYSIVAHLTEDGAPTASAFLNNVSPTGRKARVLVHHTASAPTVDVEFSRSIWWWTQYRTIEGASNGDQGAVLLPAGHWDVALFPAGGSDAVFELADLAFEQDTTYLVFAVGSLTNNTFTLLLQPVLETNAFAYVIHGIPGQDLNLAPALPVDVSLNGECALPGFTFGQIVGPLPLPAGEYDIAIALADPQSPCSGAPVITADDVTLEVGQNYSIIAHLTEGGAPTASVFVNDVSRTAPKGRVTVHHTAAAPTVDVEIRRFGWRWGRAFGLEDVSNGDQGSITLLPGRWGVSLFPAGGDDAVFGPASLTVQPQKTYLVFAVGSLTNETLTLLVEPVMQE